jgi:putative transposase
MGGNSSRDPGAPIDAVDVSPDLISAVTEAIVVESPRGKAVPRAPYALRVKIRGEAVVRSQAVYLALAVFPDGSRDILDIWIEQTEGAKFWMKSSLT